MHIFWPWVCDHHLHATNTTSHIKSVLHPGKKMAHFKKYWDASLQDDVIELVQMKVYNLCNYGKY